ncbi:12809_t:CDS:1, partial [Rhizophagus irregularis]
FALTKVPKLCSKSLYKEDKQQIKTVNIVIKNNKPVINFILK